VITFLVSGARRHRNATSHWRLVICGFIELRQNALGLNLGENDIRWLFRNTKTIIATNENSCGGRKG
jgi:hypothetical protein